jgi:hypothetical protein
VQASCRTRLQRSTSVTATMGRPQEDSAGPQAAPFRGAAAGTILLSQRTRILVFAPGSNPRPRPRPRAKADHRASCSGHLHAASGIVACKVQPSPAYLDVLACEPASCTVVHGS